MVHYVATQQSPLEPCPSQPPIEAQPAAIRQSAGTAGGLTPVSTSPDAGRPTKDRPFKRVTQSCLGCKKRKIRCSRTFPCDQCIHRGPQFAATCERIEPENNPHGNETLANRVKQLENVVRSLQQRVDLLEPQEEEADDDNSSSSRYQAAVPVTPAQPPSPYHSRANVSFRGQPEEEEGPLALEDFAMGFLTNQARTARQLNPTSLGHDMSRGYMTGAADLVTKTFLLDRSKCWSLINIYFSRLEWYTKCLHVPSVRDEAERMLTLPSAAQAFEARPSFMCILQLIQCIALHLIEPAEQAALGLQDQECSYLAYTLYSTATSALWTSDWLRRPELEWLQAVILMGVYAYNSETDADHHWSLLGSAIKAAQNLGLSRLGAESQDKHWPLAWSSFKRREIGRRVWYGLVVLDWSHAQAHNGAYSVHTSQNHSVAPHNVNDSDLTDDGPFVDRPMSEYTDTSMTKLKIQCVDLYRQFVDHLNLNQPAQYPFIIEMDAQICRLIDTFPQHFTDVSSVGKGEGLTDMVKLKECLLIRITAANRHLRLHRPYLIRGYTDERFAASKERCVNSARAVLALLKIARQRCPELTRLWIVLFYSFVASVVIFIDLTRRPNNATRQALHEALTAFRYAESNSAAARNAASLLTGLLAAEQEIRDEMTTVAGSSQGPAAKRTRTQDGHAYDQTEIAADNMEAAFRRVVYRLLSQASTESHRSTSSDSSSPLVMQDGSSTLAPQARDWSRSQHNSSLYPPSKGLEVFFGAEAAYDGLATAATSSYPGAYSHEIDGHFGFTTLSEFNGNLQ
ncbi:hypothetical protein OIO90_001107 [Microbotryomycetes sp. JL221]|nr:hypothetical protein OIO90_001107 [Microbotryomycetes sp. JL221]